MEAGNGGRAQAGLPRNHDGGACGYNPADCLRASNTAPLIAWEVTVAPVMVGGLRGVNDLGLTELQSVRSLGHLGHKWLGKDLILWGNLT